MCLIGTRSPFARYTSVVFLPSVVYIKRDKTKEDGAGICNTHGEMRNTFKLSVRKPEGKI